MRNVESSARRRSVAATRGLALHCKIPSRILGSWIVAVSHTETGRINDCLGRLRAGDTAAREELLQRTYGRLEAITRKIKRTYPDLARWEQTGDVLQEATLRLARALDRVEVSDAQHFFRLAATQIRRELIDLVRHWQGPQGAGRHHQTQAPGAGSDPSPLLADPAQHSFDPRRLSEWIEFHEAVERLPEEVRGVFDLLWYQGLSQEDAAEVLGVDVRTIKRRWREARLSLHQTLHDPPALD
jgi:RNA polymerase sigma factor (sigma-70 family)